MKKSLQYVSGLDRINIKFVHIFKGMAYLSNNRRFKIGRFATLKICWYLFLLSSLIYLDENCPWGTPEEFQNPWKTNTLSYKVVSYTIQLLQDRAICWIYLINVSKYQCSGSRCCPEWVVLGSYRSKTGASLIMNSLLSLENSEGWKVVFCAYWNCWTE